MSDESKAKSPSVAPEEIKACFICPITREIMHDPCFTCDGHTFERVAIQTWFAAGNATSPLTNLGLPSLGLVPNHALRGSIEEWLVERQTQVECMPRRNAQSMPNRFLDPLTFAVMRHPVTAADGRTYDRSSISAWIERIAPL